MAKAHKNADFVLGDGCREPSSAHWSSSLPATSPAGCIWQQCARQKIAATYHATCPVHAAGHTTVSKQPGYLLPLIPPWRYRRGATAKKLPPCATAGTPVAVQPAAVYATETYRQDLPAGAYYLALGPAPSGRVIRM